MKKVSMLGLLLLSACVTINIYFPAAAAEKVADEIIKDIQDNDKIPHSIKPSEEKPTSDNSDFNRTFSQLISKALDLIVTPAYAEEANLSIDGSDIRRLTAAMEQRFASLQGFYASGTIGIKADGFLGVPSGANVPLKDRNQVNKLIAAENADRQALYQAIANANGHPEWAAQIKATFADRWLSNAKSGWWVQSGGGWKQK